MSANIVDVILFTRQMELIKVATEHLKMKGVSNILGVATVDECVDGLKRYAKGMLVLDWSVGQAEAATVLGRNRRLSGGAMRPIMLIAEKISDQLIATAAEYAVTQIFTEEPTKKNLGARLSHMLLAETMPDEIKKALGEVQKARSEGDSKKGSKILLKLLPKHPTNLRLKCEVAELMLETLELEGALKILLGMDKTKPPYLRGIHLLGRCLMKLGRFDESLAVMEKASLFNPHDVDRLVDIGQALLQMDRIKEASRQFDQALKQEPQHHAAKLGRAQCELMDSHVNEALQILKDVASDLEMASLFNTCAVMNMRQKRHAAGMSLYESALRVLGKNQRLQSRLYYNMGLGYRRWGKKEQAVSSLEASLRLDPHFKKAAQSMALLQGGSAARAQPPSAHLPGPGGRELAHPGDAMPAPIGFLDDAGSLGLEDFTTDLDSLLSDNLEESLFKGKKPA